MKKVMAIVVIIGMHRLLAAFSGNEEATEQAAIKVSYSDRPKIISPDGEWEISVQEGRPPHLAAKSKLLRTGRPLHDIERYGWVLWRPDSKAFAFTDARYSNHSFVIVSFVDTQTCCRSEDLTPVFEKNEDLLTDANHFVDRSLAKAVRWLPDGKLLIVAFVVVSTKYELGAHDTTRGYILDVDHKTLYRVVDEKGLQSEFGVNPAKVLF